MSDYVEVHGASLKNTREKEREADLHHLRVYAHPAATPDKPRWVVSHYHSEDDSRPVSHDFTDGAKMLSHIGAAASVPPAQAMPDSGSFETKYGRAGGE